MILFGVSFWFIFPTLVLVLIGMLPSFIALLTDNDRQKTSTAAVAAMNAAGVSPFVIDLWTKGQTMENVFVILREPVNLACHAGRRCSRAAHHFCPSASHCVPDSNAL